jgi:gas vesicle protein
VVPVPRKKDLTTFVAGLGLGVAIGAALGILFAPHSGAETRRAIGRRGKKIRNGASDAWEDLRLELAATKRALKRKRRDREVETTEVEE